MSHINKLPSADEEAIMLGLNGDHFATLRFVQVNYKCSLFFNFMVSKKTLLYRPGMASKSRNHIKGLATYNFHYFISLFLPD